MIDRDPKRTYGSFAGYQDRDTIGVRGEIAWDMSFATLSFLGSYRDLEYGSRYDFDGSNPTRSLVDISGVEDERSEMSSQEVRLSSLPGGGIARVVGLYHFRQGTVRPALFQLHH